MQYFQYGYSESRLLRMSPQETPRSESAEKPIEIKESLRDLNSSVYEKLKSETQSKGVEFSQSSTIECTESDGTVRTHRYVSGFLIQKNQDGFIMTVKDKARFVPDDTFQGSIAIIENGKKRIVREAKPVQAEEKVAEPSTEDAPPTEPKNAEPVTPNADDALTDPFRDDPETEMSTTEKPETQILTLNPAKGVMGITTKSGKSLTFRSEEFGTIKNDLGSLTRKSATDTQVTFVPNPAFTEAIYFGGTEIGARPAVTQKETEKPKIVVPKAPEKTPVEPQKMNAVEPMSETMGEEVATAMKYLENTDSFIRLDVSTREFIRLYANAWQTFDRSGEIGRRVFRSNEYKALQSAIAGSRSAEVPKQQLERISRDAINALVEKMIGTPENPTKEWNAYLTQRNQLVKNRKAFSNEDAFYMIYDKRYLSNPRGKFPEKENRVPTYRSQRTQKVVEYRDRVNQAYDRLINASEADAPEAAKQYRYLDRAYQAIYAKVSSDYDKAWTSRDRSIGMRGRVNPPASALEEAQAFWKRHLSVDTLMIPRPVDLRKKYSYEQRKIAEERLEKYEPDSPRYSFGPKEVKK